MSTEHTIILASCDTELIAASQKGLPKREGYRLIVCASEADAGRRLDDVDVHLLLFDADLINDHDSNLISAARLTHPNISRVIFTSSTMETKTAAITRRSGAYLYLKKPAQSEHIALVAKRALELNEISRRHRILSKELKLSIDDQIFTETKANTVKGGPSKFERLVYASPKMFDLVEEARRAAATELPVIIQGETGTGKELLARAIHFNSQRLDSPLHVQNCGGINDEVLHSELFGHVRGSFTSAIADRLGLFRAADGGTVFLDEISEISPNFQVSLLRFLQEGEVKPLGSDKMQYSNVRIIAASNRPLSEMVEEGTFRRDLYYRLKGFELSIPPLRERREDIGMLTDFFVQKYAGVIGRNVAGVAKGTLAKLENYSYPGNVRELESEVRRMIAVADDGGYITNRHLSSEIDRVIATQASADSLEDFSGTLKERVEALETRVVQQALERNHWHQSKAAEELGLSRVGLANKIKRYALHN